MKELDLDMILQILKRNGGYPNPDIDTILESLGLSWIDFYTEIDKKYGIKEWMESNLKKMNEMNGGKGIKIELPSWGPNNFVNVRINAFDYDIHTNYIRIYLDDFEITDSLLSTPEGLLTYPELEDLVQNDDPYESENFKNEFRNTITRGLSELLAIRIS